MAFEQVMQMLVLAVVVLLFWWSHRSFPPTQTAELIQQLARASQQTQTRLDDVLVILAEVLNQRLNEEPTSSGDERSEG